eukprot:2126329-Rhodomonas_salina.1
MEVLLCGAAALAFFLGAVALVFVKHCTVKVETVLRTMAGAASAVLPFSFVPALGFLQGHLHVPPSTLHYRGIGRGVQCLGSCLRRSGLSSAAHHAARGLGAGFSNCWLA